jgi:hypothetical protein
LGILIIAPSDGCASTQARVVSTQALRLCCVSFASKLLDVATQAVRPPRPTWAVKPTWVPAPPPSSLRPRFCGSTKKSSGFLVNHCKPRELGATKEPYMISSCSSCHSNMRPTLDFVGHRVPRTKPTCLSTPGGHTDIDLSHLFFTSTKSNQVAICTCNTRP